MLSSVSYFFFFFFVILNKIGAEPVGCVCLFFFFEIFDHVLKRILLSSLTSSLGRKRLDASTQSLAEGWHALPGENQRRSVI